MNVLDGLDHLKGTGSIFDVKKKHESLDHSSMTMMWDFIASEFTTVPVCDR